MQTIVQYSFTRQTPVIKKGLSRFAFSMLFFSIQERMISTLVHKCEPKNQRKGVDYE